MAPYNANSAFIIRTGSGGSAASESELRSIVLANDSLRLKTLREMTMQYQSLFSTISAAVYTLLAVITIAGKTA